MFVRVAGTAIALMIGVVYVLVLSANHGASAASEASWQDVSEQAAEWIAEREREESAALANTVSGKPQTSVPPMVVGNSEDGSHAGAAADVGRINVNTASVEELDVLPGIGPSKAKAIIAYRETNGSFPTVESLTKVKGIGPKLLEKMKGHIRLE